MWCASRSRSSGARTQDRRVRHVDGAGVYLGLNFPAEDAGEDFHYAAAFVQLPAVHPVLIRAFRNGTPFTGRPTARGQRNAASRTADSNGFPTGM